MIIMNSISEYKEKTRTAKVYKTDKGDYHVILFDSKFDYNGFHTFQKLENAEDYTKAWVLQQ